MCIICNGSYFKFTLYQLWVKKEQLSMPDPGKWVIKESKMATGTFSATVATMILTAKKAVNDKRDWISYQTLVEFFQGLSDSVQVSMQEFSNAVAAAIRNQFFGDEERTLLAAAMTQRISAVHPGTLEIYLKATRDEAFAAVCVQNFFAHEANFDTEVGYNDPIAWDLKRALAAIEVLAPDQTQVFAATALEMFPNLPTGGDGKGGLAGLILAKAQKKSQEQQVTGMIASGSHGPVPASRAKPAVGNGEKAGDSRPIESKPVSERHYAKPAQVAFMKPTNADKQAVVDYKSHQPSISNFALAAGLAGVKIGQAPKKESVNGHTMVELISTSEPVVVQ